jgi:hypothetical protein
MNESSEQTMLPQPRLQADSQTFDLNLTKCGSRSIVSLSIRPLTIADITKCPTCMDVIVISELKWKQIPPEHIKFIEIENHESFLPIFCAFIRMRRSLH